MGMPLIGGFAEPLHRLLFVLRRSFPSRVHGSGIVLCSCVTLLGGLAMPDERLMLILRNPATGQIEVAKAVLSVDGRGVPLSLIVTGANVNDLTKLDDVLSAIVVKRPKPTLRRSKHLCADAGFRSKATASIIESHGYIAHVVDRRQEKERKRRDLKKKARRWVVEVCRSWFNRFRKLLVRYEKLERSFVALNHIAAAIIALRKVPLKINIIYG